MHYLFWTVHQNHWIISIKLERIKTKSKFQNKVFVTKNAQKIMEQIYIALLKINYEKIWRIKLSVKTKQPYSNKPKKDPENKFGLG